MVLSKNIRTKFDEELDAMIPFGRYLGWDYVNKFGRNNDIDTGTVPEDIWDAGGVWVAPTEARVHNIASDSLSDDLAGVGAQKIKVFGLISWDAEEVDEELEMDGTTNVPTANSYVIVHRIAVTQWGATNVNVGLITATAVTDATVTAQIMAGKGQTQMAIYGVPSIQDAYLTGYYISMNKGAGVASAADISFLVNVAPDNELTNFHTKHTQSVRTDGTSYLDHQFNPYNRIPGPCICKLSASDVGSNGTDISAGFDIILVSN